MLPVPDVSIAEMIESKSRGRRKPHLRDREVIGKEKQTTSRFRSALHHLSIPSQISSIDNTPSPEVSNCMKASFKPTEEDVKCVIFKCQHRVSYLQYLTHSYAVLSRSRRSSSIVRALEIVWKDRRMAGGDTRSTSSKLSTSGKKYTCPNTFT